MSSTPPPATTDFAPIAGFWSRIAAFLVDGLILALIGHGLGLVLFDLFVRLGPWGRGLGLLVALVYFVPQESVRSGQSLGKRLLRIRVVDAQGRSLGTVRGAGRFAVFGVPYFLNGAALPMDVLMFAGGVPFALLVVGGLLALAYLLAFNRRTRQSLHDLAVGSFVVRAGPRDAPAPARVWRGHLVVAGALALLAGAAPLAYPWLMSIPPFATLRALDERLAAQPELRSVGVSTASTRVYGVHSDSRPIQELRIDATIARPPVDDVALSTRLAGIALASWPDAKLQDHIAVRLAYGFDIGIASNWDANMLSLAPDQWADRVAAGVGGASN